MGAIIRMLVRTTLAAVDARQDEGSVQTTCTDEIEEEVARGGDLCKHTTSNHASSAWFVTDGDTEPLKKGARVEDHDNQHHVGCQKSPARLEVRDATFLVTGEKRKRYRGRFQRINRVLVTPEADPTEVVEPVLQKFLGGKADVDFLEAAENLSVAREWVREKYDLEPASAPHKLEGCGDLHDLSGSIGRLVQIHGLREVVEGIDPETDKYLRVLEGGDKEAALRLLKSWELEVVGEKNGGRAVVFGFDPGRAHLEVGGPMPEPVKRLRRQHFSSIEEMLDGVLSCSCEGGDVSRFYWHLFSTSTQRGAGPFQYGDGPYASKEEALEAAEEVRSRWGFQNGKVSILEDGEAVEKYSLPDLERSEELFYVVFYDGEESKASSGSGPFETAEKAVEHARDRWPEHGFARVVSSLDGWIGPADWEIDRRSEELADASFEDVFPGDVSVSPTVPPPHGRWCGDKPVRERLTDGWI